MKSRDPIDKALKAKRESKSVEFKQYFDVESAGDWCELIKDIIAIANSGGGVILIGVDNHGIPVASDVSALINFEPADITTKINKYTGIDLDVEILEKKKNAVKVAVIPVPAVSIPVVFSKPGTYETSPGKQKTAFGIGTIYFRHGAKSCPGNTEDVRMAIERQLESIRKQWIQGVRKVTTAPAGSRIFVASGEVVESEASGATPIRLTDDPSAPAYRKLDPSITHPFQQKDIIYHINKIHTFPKPFNSHDMLCLRRLFNLESDEKLMYKPAFGAFQYSSAVIDWFSRQLKKNSNFLTDSRAECRKRRLELRLYVPAKKKRGT